MHGAGERYTLAIRNTLLKARTIYIPFCDPFGMPSFYVTFFSSLFFLSISILKVEQSSDSFQCIYVPTHTAYVAPARSFLIISRYGKSYFLNITLIRNRSSRYEYCLSNMIDVFLRGDYTRNIFFLEILKQC